MIRPLVAALLAASLVTPALAQSETAPQPKRQTAPNTRRSEDRADKFAERISAALDLNEKQRQELIEIVRGHLGQGEQVRHLTRELIRATADKDAQRSAELREQLEQIRDNSSNPMASILDEIEPILTDQQAELLSRLQNPRGGSGPRSLLADPRELERLRRELDLTDEQNRQFGEIVTSASQTEAGTAEPQPSKDVFARLASILTEEQIQVLREFQTRLSPRRTQPADDVRNILRAAKKVDLRVEQRGELRRIEGEARKSRARLRRQSADVRAEFAGKLKEAIRGMLEPAQIEQFDQNLEHLVNLRLRNRRRGADQP